MIVAGVLPYIENGETVMPGWDTEMVKSVLLLPDR